LSLSLDILLTITGPIVLVIGAGWWLQPRLALDIASLNRLIVQVVLPAFFVHYLSTSTVPVAAAWTTAWFTALQVIGLIAIGWTAARMLGLAGAAPIIVGLATAVSNSASFGLPITELAFGADMILHQAVIVSAQTIFVFTLGPILLLGGSDGWRTGLRTLKSPLYPAIIIGLALNAFDIELPDLVATPFAMLGGLYLPLALVTLGAQLATSNSRVLSMPVTLSVALKLAIAPIVTGLALIPLGFDPGLADLLIVTAAAPVGVTLAIVAAQVERERELATAAVVVTTLLSPLTVTLCLFWLRMG
jgi:predicted permease